MTGRLAAGMLVSVLLRRIEASGGNGAVLARGDATAGALLIQLTDRGNPGPLLERTLTVGGLYAWQPIGPEDAQARMDYISRRRRTDPDLWVIELDGPEAAGIVREVSDAGGD